MKIKNSFTGLMILLAFFYYVLPIQAANEDPTQVENQGIMMIQQGQEEEGFKLVKHATELDSQNPTRHLNYGSLLFAKGSNLYQRGNTVEATPILKESEEELTKAADLLAPQQDKTSKISLSQTYYLLGDLNYYVHGNKAKAKAFYTKAVEINPAHGGAENNLKTLQFE